MFSELKRHLSNSTSKRYRKQTHQHLQFYFGGLNRQHFKRYIHVPWGYEEKTPKGQSVQRPEGKNMQSKERSQQLGNRKSAHENLSIDKTSRERHKSAQYQRLKYSKRTSKCQVFFYSTWKTQKWDRIGLKNIKKIEGGPFGEKKLEKSLTMQKKMKAGSFGIFQHPFCRKTS